MPPKISDSEMEVLQVLMQLGQATTASLHQHMAQQKPWAYSTVVTFLRRLETKGLVEHERIEGERAFVYRPARKAQTVRRTALREMLDRVFGGNAVPLVSSLLEEAKLNPKELDELRNLIDKHSASKGKKS